MPDAMDETADVTDAPAVASADALEETLVGAGSEPGPARAVPGRGASVGRYVVLSELGTGATGVVFAAYDPELDRKIALKLLKPRGENRGEAQSRLQREALALAKLSHTNVVTVHDVGVHDGQVFIAMEFVEGQTLADWMDAAAGSGPRPWREVVRLFEAAGRGLAAAHAQGLIHRDFKPDNVMVGTDGRVRVMDFGLARANEDESSSSADLGELASEKQQALGTRMTRTGAMMGTPAYMAPEQFSGTPTHLSDQFGYCVALYEALYGERPFAGGTPAELAFSVLEGEIRDTPRGVGVPAWLRKIALRGLSVRPEDRFDAMSDLIAALATVERRRRRNRVVAAVTVVGLAIAGAVGGQHYEQARRTNACADVGAAIEEVWNEDRREALRAGLLATKASYAETAAEKAAYWIDQQAESWQKHATAACMNATVHESWDAAKLGKAEWCLEERRVEIDILVNELVSADKEAVTLAVQAATALPPVLNCVDETSLSAMKSPPSEDVRAQVVEVRKQLQRVRYLQLAGEYRDALDLVRDTRTRAEQLSWTPLLAAVRTREANLLGLSGAHAEAEAAGVAAYMEAAESATWGVAASAASELTRVVGEQQARHAEGQTWADHARVAITHAGDPAGLREARRLDAVGVVRELMSDYEQAKELYERAKAIREGALAPNHPLLAKSLGNLANVHESLGNYEEAKGMHEQSIAIWTDALGPNHPFVAASLNNYATLHHSVGNYTEALKMHERALAIRERALGAEHPLVAMSLTNLGLAHAAMGSHERATPLHERAVAIWEQARGAEHPDIAAGLNNLCSSLVSQGQYEAARVACERALTIWERALGPDHPDVAYGANNLGLAHQKLGNYETARSLHERALTSWETALGSDHPAVAAARIGLGGALLELGELRPAILHLELVLARDSPGVTGPPETLAGAQFLLARALWDAPSSEGRDRARARTLAAQARDMYAAQGERAAKELERARTWLDGHPL